MDKQYQEKEIARLTKWIEWCDGASKKITKVDGEDARLNTFRQKQWAECLLGWYKKKFGEIV